ncbi:MAG TPA: molybdopterin-dependent oxidoreductase [Rubrobacteraceae bacterium]|nr:molybdopterin-dependent oxidoreductase [Rubrobacteraceae bacterium]
MSGKTRAGIAGVVGAVVAFGAAELVHGLYSSVPSVFAALVQGIIEFTPGELVTRGIEILGQADIPVLIACTVIGALAFSAVLANLAVRRPLLALLGVAILAVIGVAASLAQPFVAPVPTVVTVVGALILGAAVTETLLRASGLRAEKAAVPEPAPPPAGSPDDPTSPVLRSREAYSSGGTAVGRRGFLLLGGGAAVAGLAALGAGRVLAGRGGQAAAEPGKLNLPESPAEPSGGEEGGARRQGGGQPGVRHETLPPPPEDASIDVPGMPKLITPAASFYLIDTALVSPRIDVNGWKLSVKGAVDNPVEFSYKDLLGMNTREADITLSCVSNTVGGGLVSNGRWTGVLLSDVLAEAGMSRDKITRASQQLVGRSVDGFTAGFRTEIALDGREALVAFGLNGSELPVKHGYPVRLVVPGLYGYISATKWLSELELTSWDFDAYWIQRTWAKEGPVKTQSRIDTVKDGDRLSAGKILVGGIAWAPHRGIERVELSTDGGGTWNAARLARQLDLDSWRQWVYEWDARPGEYTLQVRATDGTGETQTASEAPPHPSGATGYHTIGVTVA